MFLKTQFTKLRRAARKDASLHAHGRLNTSKLALRTLTNRIRITMRISLNIAAAILTLLTCSSCGRAAHYGPREKNVSDRRVTALTPGMTAQEVRRRLGEPSFVWPRRV